MQFQYDTRIYSKRSLCRYKVLPTDSARQHADHQRLLGHGAASQLYGRYHYEAGHLHSALLAFCVAAAARDHLDHRHTGTPRRTCQPSQRSALRLCMGAVHAKGAVQADPTCLLERRALTLNKYARSHTRTHEHVNLKYKRI